MIIKIDIHNAKKRTERAKINLKKKFSDYNAKIDELMKKLKDYEKTNP